MSSIDDDLFGPIDGLTGKPGGTHVSATTPDQIEQLFQLLSSMPNGEEVTLNFARPEGHMGFHLRLLGKYGP